MVHFCDQKHHVVVIGAGFGGLSVVRELEEPGVSITIIDRSNHHLFQPLLYQVAGASLPSAEIAWPVRSLFRHREDVRTLMAEARRFEPRTQAFPEALPGNAADVSAWVDEGRLRQTLLHALPVPNLMHWLTRHYPTLPDEVLLRLYHDLVREPDWQAQLHTAATSTELNTVRVSYHPHQLSAHRKDKITP